jgi:poly-gamma-glutamate system protein
VQKLYWRPAQVSTLVHVLVAVIAIATLLSVERFQVSLVQDHFEEKLQAANRMRKGMEVIRLHRIQNVAPIDREVDPADSGLIGEANSSVTTSTGSLEAKRTTANPNWAAVVVDLLLEAGVRPGDLVAVGVSGSFPALNLAAFVAADVLGLEFVSIASAGASSFGANFPSFMWLDMERLLYESKVISRSSAAGSLGGTLDRAVGIPSRGRKQLRDALDRNGVPFIEVVEEAASIDQRMEIYDAYAAGRRIAAYINVGGSLVSTGPKSAKRLYRPGLNRKPNPRGIGVDNVMMRFLRDGVPVINLSKVVALAEAHGIPIEPQELPPVGSGPVFEKREHSRPLVAGLLVFLLLTLYGLLKLELGARITALVGRRRQMERMV